MSVIKYIQRLNRMDGLIRRCATGRPESFAKKLGLGRSTLMEYIRELREIGAPISYCKRRESYYYQEEKQLFIGYTEYQLGKTQERDLRGGALNYINELWKLNLLPDEAYLGKMGFHSANS